MGRLNWIEKSRLSKFWRSLIQRSSFTQGVLFTDPYTATNTNFDSSTKFGTFFFHVSGPSCFQGLHETTTLMLSSPRSEFEPEPEPVPVYSNSRSGGGWCWSTDDDKSSYSTTSPLNAYFDVQDIAHKIKYGKYDDYAEENVFKVFSNKHQIHHMFKLIHVWIPPCYKFLMHPKYIVGSCNGLICLFDKEHMDICLWNPNIITYKILPKWITTVETERFRQVRHSLVALGFDVETNDHKVMVVIWSSPRPSFRLFERQNCVCQVQIYSLSTDSWRVLEDIDYLPGIPINQALYHSGIYHSGIYHSVYLNGSCFFIANFYPSQPMFGRFIISFDFSKEIFTTMPFPDHDEKQELFLTSLGEKLAFFSVCYQFPIVYPMGLMVEDYDIWVMNKHSGSGSNVKKKSWTKLHSFQTITEGECTVPIGISNDGEFALLELRGKDGMSKKMQLYNLVTKEAKKDFLYCSGVWSKAIAYQPSLVKLHSPRKRIPFSWFINTLGYRRR